MYGVCGDMHGVNRCVNVVATNVEYVRIFMVCMGVCVDHVKICREYVRIYMEFVRTCIEHVGCMEYLRMCAEHRLFCNLCGTSGNMYEL